MTSKNTLLKSIAVILSGTIALRVVKLVFTPFLVRVVGQARFGTFASVMAVCAIVSLISKVGLFDSVRKHVAEFEIGSTEQGVLVSNAAVLAVLYGLAGTAVVVALTYLPLGFGPGAETYLLLLGLAIVPHNLYSVFRGAFYGQQREQSVEVIHVGRELAFVACGLGLAVLGYGLAGVFAGYVCSVVAAALVTGWMVRRDFAVSSSQVAGSVTRYTGKIARYGGAQGVGGVAAMLLYQTDVLLTSYFRTAAETGLYKAALIPAQFIWIVPTVIQMSLLQNTAGHWANGRIEAIEAIEANVRNGLRYAFLALTLFGVGLYALADEFLRVYFGPGFGGERAPPRDTHRRLVSVRSQPRAGARAPEHRLDRPQSGGERRRTVRERPLERAVDPPLRHRRRGRRDDRLLRRDLRRRPARVAPHRVRVRGARDGPLARGHVLSVRARVRPPGRVGRTGRRGVADRVPGARRRDLPRHLSADGRDRAIGTRDRTRSAPRGRERPDEPAGSNGSNGPRPPLRAAHGRVSGSVATRHRVGTDRLPLRGSVCRGR